MEGNCVARSAFRRHLFSILWRGGSAPVTHAPVASNQSGWSPSGCSRLCRAMWSSSFFAVGMGTTLGGVVRPRRLRGVNARALLRASMVETWVTAPTLIRTGDRLPPPRSQVDANGGPVGVSDEAPASHGHPSPESRVIVPLFYLYYQYRWTYLLPHLVGVVKP